MLFEIVFAFVWFLIAYLTINGLWLALFWELGLFCIKLLMCACVFWTTYSIYRSIEDFIKDGSQSYQDPSRMLVLLKQKCQNLELENSTLKHNAQEVAEKYHKVSGTLAVMTKEIEAVKNERQAALRDRTYQITLTNELYQKLKSYEAKISKKDDEILILKDQCEQHKIHKATMSIDELPSHLKAVLNTKHTALMDQQRKNLTDAADKQLKTLMEQQRKDLSNAADKKLQILMEKHEKELQVRDNAHKVALQKLDEKHNNNIVRNLESENIVQMKQTEEALRHELKTAQVTEQQLRETIKALSHNIEEAQAIVHKITELEAEVSSMKQTEDTLRLEIKLADNKATRFREQTQLLLKERETVSQSSQSEAMLYHNLRQAQATVLNLTERETSIRNELQNAQVTAQKLSESEKFLNEEVAAAQATVRALQVSDKELRSSLAQAQMLADNYKRIADRSQSAVNELKADLSSAQAYISQLQNEVAEKNQIIENGNQTVQELIDTKARLEAALSEMASASKQQDGTQDKTVKLEELERLKEDYSCLRTQKDQIMETLWKLQDILLQSGAEETLPFDHVRALDEVTEKLEAQYEKALRELKAANQAIEVAQNATLAKSNLEIEASLAILEEERNQLKAENVELKNALKSTRPMAKPVSKLKQPSKS